MSQKPVALSIRRKSGARLAAVQCIYRLRINHEDISAVDLVADYLEQFSDDKLLPHPVLSREVAPDKALLNRIVEGVIENMPAIEETVKGSLSEKWKLERMSILLTSILECAVFEMLYSLPHKKIVIINEYVNLSKRFFEESEIGFVNAFLAGLINAQPGAGQIQEDE